MHRPHRFRLLVLSIATAGLLPLAACQTPEPAVQKVSARPLQPARGEAVVVEQVVIVLDSSGSLDDGRFYEARAVAESIVDASPEGDYELGAVAFGGFDRDAVPLARFDRETVRSRTAATPHLESGTPVHKVLADVGSMLEGRSGRAAVVVISDGEFTDEFGRPVETERVFAAARELEAGHDGSVCIHTVQVGESAVGAEVLRQLSEVTTCGSARSRSALGDEARLHALGRDVFLGAGRVAAAAPSLPPVSAPGPAAPTSWSVNFGFDSATVAPMYGARLGQVADRLEASPGARVEISGHTDSKGDAEYNRRLSMRRAEATRDALVEAGVPASRIDLQGFGEDSLLGPDDDEKGAAANRRTEIRIVDSPR